MLSKLMEEWRVFMTADYAIDNRPPPTDEEVLNQFVYGLITDFIENHDVFALIENDDLDETVLAWLDEGATVST